MATIWLSSYTNEEPGRRVQRTLSSGTTDDWIILNTTEKDSTITVEIVIAASGSGSLEFTIEDYASIDAGTAVGVVWDFGTVGTTTVGYFPAGVTGVRFVRATGEIKGCVAI